MKKITPREFEELIQKDEALMAKAKEIIGEGEELKEKVKAFAASLGYEVVASGMQELSLEDLENVAGGNNNGICWDDEWRCSDGTFDHDWEIDHIEDGILFGYNYIMKCTKCGKEDMEWGPFW